MHSAVYGLPRDAKMSLRWFDVLQVLLIVTAVRCTSVEPRCDKIDQCSCKLKNVRHPGIINLHSLVDGEHQPRFVSLGSESPMAPTTQYNYFYNPCSNFTVPKGNYNYCENAALCQTTIGDYYQAFNLGTIDSVRFVYENNTVVAVYQSVGSNNVKRITQVELVCDPDEILGKFVFIKEQPLTLYRLRLYTRCACPGKCKSVQKECIMKDACSCEMSDGSGIIDLHSLDSPAVPMQDSLSPSQTFLYNPCSLITSVDCGNNTVCMKSSDSSVGLGLANTSKFITEDDGIVSIKYSNPITGKSAKIQLNCDRGTRQKPLFRLAGINDDEYSMSVFSVCACPGGCITPSDPPAPPTSHCSQIDSCSCKVDNTGKLFSLHKLDNPYAPLKTIGIDEFPYYYNPCSGIQLVTEKGKCQGVSACKDLFYKYSTITSLGGTSSTINYYNADNITIHYSGGDGGRNYDVQVICDVNADVPKFVMTEPSNSPPILYYKFNLTTSLACM